jgi:hypothetical protein
VSTIVATNEYNYLGGLYIDNFSKHLYSHRSGLADRNATVRKNMLTAALVTVDLHGKHTVSSLLPIFENLLDRAPKNSASYDSVRQSVVILMGSLARHLEPTDPRIKPIVKKLIEALSTPSQQVM